MCRRGNSDHRSKVTEAASELTPALIQLLTPGLCQRHGSSRKQCRGHRGGSARRGGLPAVPPAHPHCPGRPGLVPARHKCHCACGAAARGCGRRAPTAQDLHRPQHRPHELVQRGLGRREPGWYRVMRDRHGARLSCRCASGLGCPAPAAAWHHQQPCCPAGGRRSSVRVCATAAAPCARGGCGRGWRAERAVRDTCGLARAGG
mmetsp:Transcript_20775/g.52768  ORF Transcript_20775/g.52768 Transcript_20775/m.52768 type:complete len:204 (-) Transcript_20775:1615-2226(-)